jgi:hypothetical protein
MSKVVAKMIELREFCASLQLDENRAREALMSERGEETSALVMPWYVRLVVGVAAWITALVATGLGAAILFIALETDSGIAISTLGAVYFGTGLLLLRVPGSGIFLAQLGLAIAAAGVALIALGAGFETEEIWPATVASAVLTAMIIAITPNRTLQFLSALLTAVLFCVTLSDLEVPYYLDLVSLGGLAGVALMLRPPQRDLQPLAVVLLLMFPTVAIFGPDTIGWLIKPGAGVGWFAKTLHIGLFLWLVFVHWQRATMPEARERLMPFAVAAVLVCMLLPPGSSAALVIMMLAFVLGSRPLALLGTLLQIHYIWRFYYDLEITLLAKSGILAAVGVVLLAAWWLMLRRTPEGVRM